MKKRLRSPAVLLVAFAMVVVTAGVVYAHWTSTSSIQGNINTGNIGMGWDAVGTNDDGYVDNDLSGNDDQTGIVWGAPDNYTSRDPSAWDNPAARYDKNVASCWADGGGDMMNVNIDNAYPSYYCHLFANAYNWGSVPVMAAGLTLSAEKGSYACTAHLVEADGQTGNNPVATGEGEFGTFIDVGNDGVFTPTVDGWMSGDNLGPFAEVDGAPGFSGIDFRFWDHCVWNGSGMTLNPTGHVGEFLFNDELTFHIEDGILCGTQVDPNQGIPTMGWIHIEQPAEQGAQYQFTLTQEWVNWNEWDASMCTFNEPETETVRVWSSAQNFSDTGWAGWSCPATHPDAVGAGASKVTGSIEAPVYPIEARVAEPAMATFHTFDYPVFPHWTYPGGEEGVAAHNGGTAQTAYLWVDCMG